MSGEYPFTGGPYLEAAFICEKVLQESDGIKSAIRIIDRLNRHVSSLKAPMEMEAFEHEMFLFIRFKSGSARGPMAFQLKMVKPSGESPIPFRSTVIFEGEDDRGVDIVTQMRIKFDQAGLYWFWVSLNEIMITRIPFRIVYIPQIIQMPPGGNNPLPPQAQE
jgi:hypothetical protein